MKQSTDNGTADIGQSPEAPMDLLKELGSKVWEAPATYACSEMDVGSIKAIYYDGLSYGGKKTRVFAYIGYPENTGGLDKVPAVVLAHGGGGMAYADWVKQWNSRGYAAIAVDLEGKQPDKPGGYNSQLHQWNGPTRTGDFDDLFLPLKDQWMYHAVADILLANSLLRSDPRIDSTKIGLTGISWGGIVSSIVMGNDDRFAFVIPVYGCGYMNDSSSYFGGVFQSNTAALNTWEPSRWIENAKMPVLWLNGDKDKFFSITSTSLSAQHTPKASLSIINNLAHGHAEGWAPQEIYAFADSIVKEGAPLIQIVEQPSKTKPSIKLSIPPGRTVKRILVFYTTGGIRYDESYNCITEWDITLGKLSGEDVTYSVPEEAAGYYVSILDDQNLTVSTQWVNQN